MKKISNVEVKIINLNATDVIATSGEPSFGAAFTTGNHYGRIDSRGYYDYYDDDEEW